MAVTKHTRKKFKEATASKGDPDELKLGDGDKVKVFPLQELDADADNYDSEMGEAAYVKIWKHPREWTKEIADTQADEGGCVPAELARIKGNWNYGWKAQDRIYINVLVDNGVDEPYVAYLKSSTNARATVGPALEEYESNNDTVLTWFSYGRTGTGVDDTTYTFSPLAGKKAPESPNVLDYKDKLVDLDTKIKTVPYAEQEAYLNVNDFDRVEKEKVGDKWVAIGGSAAPTESKSSDDSEEDPDW